MSIQYNSLRDFLDKWGMENLRIKTPFLDATFKTSSEDSNAAWELYIEMLTRIATQKLPDEYGDEKAALDSIYQLFPLTREILKKYKTRCIEFLKIAVPVLNQIIRPFTSKWHTLSLKGAFEYKENCDKFREDLKDLQSYLKKYMGMLAEMAGVEDLTELEENS
mgnify:CR=1 FL=1